MILLKKLSLTKSLNLSIPLVFSTVGPEYPELDALQPEFWRFELMYKSEFKPKNLKTKRDKHFNLQKFMTRIALLKPNFAIYMGSNTTPPCEGN